MTKLSIEVKRIANDEKWSFKSTRISLIVRRNKRWKCKHFAWLMDINYFLSYKFAYFSLVRPTRCEQWSHLQNRWGWFKMNFSSFSASLRAVSGQRSFREDSRDDSFILHVQNYLLFLDLKTTRHQNMLGISLRTSQRNATSHESEKLFKRLIATCTSDFTQQLFSDHIMLR